MGWRLLLFKFRMVLSIGLGVVCGRFRRHVNLLCVFLGGWLPVPVPRLLRLVSPRCCLLDTLVRCPRLLARRLRRDICLRFVSSLLVGSVVTLSLPL